MSTPKRVWIVFDERAHTMGSDSRRDLSIALGIKEPHPLGCVGLVKWNDAPSTTYKKVLERLRKAATP